MEWDDDFLAPELENVEERHDPKVEEAKIVIKRFFEEQQRAVVYLKQLQVRFEKQFFHWVTGFAVGQLVESGFLKEEMVPFGSAASTRAKFLFRSSHRFRKRQIQSSTEVIDSYSRPDIGRACGQQAEILFALALLKEGFRWCGQNTSVYREKRWVETNHDLDFIVERDCVTYGCEVKNRLEYIGKDELEVKLKMCGHLGIRPMFIMRGSPKNYNQMIIEQGGYAWIFETQIYPPGHERLVEQMRDRLGLPALCSREIPRGMIERFLKWHRSVSGV
ncbi:MAG: hypothetical protein ACRD4H_04095 [Candidatus Acidiferrales bacterium]